MGHVDGVVGARREIDDPMRVRGLRVGWPRGWWRRRGSDWGCGRLIEARRAWQGQLVGWPGSGGS
ncbi:hypothetical protein, partial [Mycobacterium persicum]|uniref:hypothetical protein n=1 Tax=Mycobacterium persicum TaxID=1487726 RepID=UPI001C818106